MPFRMLVIDDHLTFADTLAVAFRHDRSFEVVGTASNGTDGFQMGLNLRPDIVLSDFQCPGRGVFDIAQDLKHRVPALRFVILSAYCNDTILEQALRIPVDGYLLKTEPFEVILNALKLVMTGQPRFSPEVEERLDRDAAGNLVLKQTTGLGSLSSRQIEVLRHLADGHSAKEIARIMHLSAKSIDSHKYRIMQRLNIHDRVGLANFARREGLVTN